MESSCPFLLKTNKQTTKDKNSHPYNNKENKKQNKGHAYDLDNVQEMVSMTSSPSTHQ
jgi:hypothetical protein